MIPDIGVLSLRCPAMPIEDPSARWLILTPSSSARRTAANLTTFQSSGTTVNNASFDRAVSDNGSPIVVPIPNNGMISGTFSVEPSTGGSVDPGTLPTASITLSSVWKVNDLDSAKNFCFASAQVVA